MRPLLSPEMTAKELLELYPEIVPVLINLGFLCVGCPAAAFDTLIDVARENGFERDQLIEWLEILIDSSGKT
jgi:hybrid cluster-associated redox disulfide protein